MAANNGRLVFGRPTKGKPPGMSALGRICGTDGCTTRLSVYNTSDDCALHERHSFKRQRDRI